ncbi:hypothetical protein PR048_032324 [Dryococelus australis]|uniref:PID domain-containing protein n=1 Tax=Dryococelus australis TaxID=614101 RepID=A0ABQ9G1W7_9NEOP|nr:hypothetical protein PR048_032324 [Dryococelus australis]
MDRRGVPGDGSWDGLSQTAQLVVRSPSTSRGPTTTLRFTPVPDREASFQLPAGHCEDAFAPLSAAETRWQRNAVSFSPSFLDTSQNCIVYCWFRQRKGIELRVQGQEARERYGRQLTRTPSASSLLRARPVSLLALQPRRTGFNPQPGPLPDFHMWESCRRMFSRGSPFSPPPFCSLTAPFSPRFNLIGSEDLDTVVRIVQGSCCATDWSVSLMLLQSVHMAHALRRISYATCDPEHAQFSFLAREPKGHFSLQYCHTFHAQSAEQDKLDVKHVHTGVDVSIGSQFIRHALDDSEPIEDVQGNK